MFARGISSVFSRVRCSLTQRTLVSSTKSHSSSSFLATVAALGAAAAYAASDKSTAHASGDTLPLPEYPFDHHSVLSAYDTGSIRRGFQVYKQVCASCHGLKRIAYRNLIGVSHTEEEAKALAAEETYMDGPDDEGNMFERPGKLSDYIKSPYANEKAARAANNGAYPPDLSLIVKARVGADNYLMALLTGYRDPPAGINVEEGKHYNPYFPGGVISMKQALYDGSVDYEDGTPNTASQAAKDVSTFLAWCSEPEADERKIAGTKVLIGIAIAAVFAGYWKRFRWSALKNRRITFK